MKIAEVWRGYGLLSEYSQASLDIQASKEHQISWHLGGKRGDV